MAVTNELANIFNQEIQTINSLKPKDVKKYFSKPLAVAYSVDPSSRDYRGVTVCIKKDDFQIYVDTFLNIVIISKDSNAAIGSLDLNANDIISKVYFKAFASVPKDPFVTVYGGN